jgi:hypothetical protein
VLGIARWTEALTLIEAKLEFYDEWVAKGARPAVGPHRRVWRAAQRHRGPRRRDAHTSRTVEIDLTVNGRSHRLAVPAPPSL